jgi:PAS domain-containing protein
MLNLEWIRAKRNLGRALLANGALVLSIATGEWCTSSHFSLGLLYVFPSMLAAVFLPRWAVVLQGIGCALLSLHFTNLDPPHGYIQFAVEAVVLIGCGLVVAGALHREPSSDVQQRMSALAETGPLAIMIVNDCGTIEAANSAAVELLAPRSGLLIGQPVAGFFPPLHYALHGDGGPQFRTSMQCRGYLGNGRPFLARVWFSTSKQGMTPKLAAIIADVREQQSVA